MANKRSMLRMVFITGLLLLWGCKQEDTKHTVPAKPVSTHYLKNTPLAVDTLLLKNKSLKDFYRANSYKTAWTDSINRLALLQAIHDAPLDGLHPRDYNYEMLQEQEADTTITPEECVKYDILLTESFRKLATHLFKGKTNPRRVYHDWDLPPKKLDANALLEEALKERSIAAVLERCRPPHPVYKGLRKSLKYLDSLPDDMEPVKISVPKPIAYRDSGAVMAAVKNRLAYWGDLARADTKGTVYDRKTLKAVKRFQGRHGIYPNGALNSATIAALNVPKAERRAQVMANLERWRWFPYDMGKRSVIINIPDYRLFVVENNRDTVEIHKVVVGRPERRTPVLSSRLNYLVLNPTWTVPPTILKEDLAPSATKDTAYFANLNMKIYDYYNNEIPVAEWKPEEADRYYYVQGPGERNTLGQVKFNFRNSHTVYLHDTNHKEYFGHARRALSSGCVRVQNPLQLALYLLEQEEDGWTGERLQEMISAGLTEKVTLEKATRVHQLYWTAWMGTNGLQFRNDIYGLDTVLYKKLGN